jgi:hypothetical protein
LSLSPGEVVVRKCFDLLADDASVILTSSAGFHGGLSRL